MRARHGEGNCDRDLGSGEIHFVCGGASTEVVRGAMESEGALRSSVPDGLGRPAVRTVSAAALSLKRRLLYVKLESVRGEAGSEVSGQ